MRPTITWTPVLALLLALPACKDKGDDTSGTESDADTDSDSDTDTDTDTDDTGTEYGEGNLYGTVTWADGTPAEGVQARLCYHSCRAVMTDASGAFAFEGAEATVQTFHVVVLGKTIADYAIPNFPVAVPEDDSRTLDPVAIPEWTTSTPISGSQTVTGDHIALTADASGMSWGSYSPSPDEAYVATYQADPTTAGVPFDGISGEVLGLWYLGNFDVTVSPAWPAVIDADLGLSEGETVHLWVASNETKEWAASGTATVAADGTLVTDSGGGVGKLTTLLVVKP